jgi:hypothetical protein
MRTLLWLRAAVVGVGLSWADDVSAAGLCEGIDVKVEAQPTPRWNDVLSRTCSNLEAIPDRDPTASIRLVPSEDDLLVEVVLTDGRSAIRRVTSPSALRSAIEALLALPPEAASKPTRRVPERSPAPEVLPPESKPTSHQPAVVESPPSRSTTADLALSIAGRAGGSGFFSVAPTAEAYLISGRWLFGLSARWDALQHVVTSSNLDYSIESAAAGLAIARRIELPVLDLDVGFSPRMVVESEGFDIQPPPTDDDAEDDISRTSTDVRVAFFGRALVGHGPVRFFTGIDGELSPARLRRVVRAASYTPALPAWSLGLAAGVSWSTP